MLTGFVFNSAPGRTVQDTKLDLVVDPVRFLSRSLHLWDPIGAGGQLQEQAYGYLFPMGPFFALGHLAHVPPWAIQRLWWSLVLSVAFLGVVVLCARLGVGTPTTRLVGGLIFALSPHVLTVLGPVSAEAWPMALAAWVVVPLVGGAERGAPRRAAMLSGLAILAMGGINAALDFTALLPAVLWLLTRRPGPRMWRLIGWWALAVVLACTWWLVPLLLFARYSPPFLSYIESASVTTQVTSLTESLRGTGDWVPYLSTSGWHAGWILLSQPAVIVNSVVLVVLGLLALTMRRTPHRVWLVTMLLVGVTCLAAGHLAGVDGFAPEQIRRLLDGLAAPLRNVHKFDVLIRLPLAIGAAALLDALPWARGAAERAAASIVATALALVAVAGSAAPLLALQLAPDNSFASIPAYWSQAASWLNANDAQGRALLLPASSFGQYIWGSTGDEPLQTLATTPWEVRSAIPLVPAGHIMMLDTVEQQIAAGEPSAGLAPYLARAGIRYLVVRNDLTATAAPRPILVHEALDGSAGLHLERTFGPEVGGVGDANLAVDQDLQLSYPAVEIWSVDDPSDPRVSVASLSSVDVVNGGPATTLDLAATGLIDIGPTVLAGAGSLPAGIGPSIMSDSLRRRETNFGGPPGLSSSATLGPSGGLILPKLPADYTLPGGPSRLATADIVGLAGLTASSSGADPQSFIDTAPAEMPFSALDGDRTTAWLASPGQSGLGQWLQLAFTSSTAVNGTTVLLPANSPVTQLTVRTDRGSVSTPVGGVGSVSLATPPGSTRTLRVTVSGLRPGPASYQQVGIAELDVPGIHAARTIEVPADPPIPGSPAEVPATIDFSAPLGSRAGCLVANLRAVCAQGLAQDGEEVSGLDRSFVLPAAATYQAQVWVTPRSGAGLDQLIQAAVHPRITATATSSAVTDPLGQPVSAVDGDFGTGWVADPGDPAPTITVRWRGDRTLTSIRLVSDPFLAATPAQFVQISTPTGTRKANVAADGTVTFAPLKTDQLSIRLSAVGLRPTYDPTTQTTGHLGLGVSEVLVPGVTASRRSDSDPTPVDLPCGSTPKLTVDGCPVLTEARTSVEALRDEQPIQLLLCGSARTELGVGAHRLISASTPTFAVDRVLLTTPASTATTPNAGLAITAQPEQWGPTSRTVRVGSRSSGTVLVVHENANAGWHASAAGKALSSITIDGWQQGYIVPAGLAETVHLTFAPDQTYRWGLLLGLVLALILIVGAAWPARDGKAEDLPSALGLRGRLILPIVGVLTLALVGGWWGVLAAAAWPALTLGAGVVRRGRAGDVPWSAMGRRSPVVVAGASYLVCGAVLAHGHWGSPHYLASTAGLQIGCLIALATVVAGQDCAGWSSWLLRVRDQRESGSGPPRSGAGDRADSAGS